MMQCCGELKSECAALLPMDICARSLRVQNTQIEQMVDREGFRRESFGVPGIENVRYTASLVRDQIPTVSRSF